MRGTLRVRCSSSTEPLQQVRQVREVPRSWVQKAAATTHAAARNKARAVNELQKKLYSGIQTAVDPSDAPSSSGRATSGAPDIVRERLLLDALKRKKWLQERDLTRMDVVAQRLVSLSTELDMDVSLLAQMAATQGCLLLVPPDQLRQRFEAISQALALSQEQVLELAAREPKLLTRRTAATLQRALPDLVALFKSRGLPLAEMAAARPDLLLESPHSLKAKIDGLPSALDLSPRRTRDMLTGCPDLLRRSTRALQERYQALLTLFSGLPRAFVTELLSAAPSLLFFSPQTLRAKFNALLARYGAFADDIVDMVLVDPSLLLGADPLFPAPTSSGSSSSSYDGSDGSYSAAGRRGKGASATGPTGTVNIRQAPRGPPSLGPQALGAGSVPAGATGPAARAPRTSPVEQLLQMAAQAQVPLYDTLQLCVLDPSLCHTGPGALVQRLTCLQDVLGLPAAEAQLLASRLPSILSLTPEQLAQRAEALRRLWEQQGSGFPAAGTAQQGELAQVSSGSGDVLGQTQALFCRHPELLLQDADTIRAKLDTLQQVLGVPLARLLRLLESQPGLVLGDTDAVVDRLEGLRAVLGNLPMRLVGELAVKEPRLLQVPLDSISARFEMLAASFGSFRDDAVDIVLADPTKLLALAAAPVSTTAQASTAGAGAAHMQQSQAAAQKTKGAARKRAGGKAGGNSGGEASAGAAAESSQRQAVTAATPDFESLLDEMILGESARAKEKEQRRMKARREKKQAREQKEQQ